MKFECTNLKCNWIFSLKGERSLWIYIYEIKHLEQIDCNERVGILDNKLYRTSKSVSFLSFENFLYNFHERCCTLLVTASLLGLNLFLYKTVLIKRKQTKRKLHFSIVFGNEPVPFYSMHSSIVLSICLKKNFDIKFGRMYKEKLILSRPKGNFTKINN